MAGVGILGTIIIGLLAGWLAERFTRSNHGLLTNLLLGVVGALAFAWVVRHFGIVPNGPNGWLPNLVGGTIGAVVLIWLYRQFRR
ncbi:GlsB/YeaQ/YmgE family stress response membrane protein [Pleomorphomonas sp. PLEO]|uniref:GlsB/YeaQ/YmgE family stress response membrane protein n=1 Tax=Pleomorphomonas sp. PLEO TaxID=3239306 RepID=UPI00351E9DC8